MLWRNGGFEVGIRWGDNDKVKISVDELKRQISIRFRTFIWLLKEFSWDFAMVVFNETDFAQHMFPIETAKLEDV
jgi:predicted AlkP superfamily phosphohydrolase/phosphomutase